MGEARIDMEEMTRSLTGFDEIAIERAWGKAFNDLGGTTLARALLFVAERRDGMKDADAYRAVMDLRLDALESRFEVADDEVVTEGKAPAIETAPTPISS